MTKKEMFERYEKVRKSGEYNMVMDAGLAMMAAGLTQTEYIYVIENYNELAKKYKKQK
jgi:hypothetical protein